MKYRLGFVSNSSSTSFCIYGKYFDNISNETQDEIIKQELQVISGQYEGYYVGRSLSTIKDNETGKEFKEDVLKKINKIFPELKKEDLDILEDGWYDG